MFSIKIDSAFLWIPYLIANLIRLGAWEVALEQGSNLMSQVTLLWGVHV